MSATARVEAKEHFQVAQMAPGKGSFYLPQLDALRFFAFAAVFLHHGLRVGRYTFVRDALSFGLSLFFFLSSYLITRLGQLELQRTGTISLRSFYLRRMLRIWPLYFAYLISFTVLGQFWRPAHVTGLQFGLLTALAGNWLWALSAGTWPTALSHLWSISVEEQFYAVWPALLRSLKKKVFQQFAGALALGSLLLTAVVARHHSSLSIWLNTGSEAIFFAGGALLALRSEITKPASCMQAASRIVVGLGLWLAAEAIGHPAMYQARPTPWRITAAYLLVALGCQLLLEGALRFPPDRVPAWVVHLGKISYGLYVFHAIALQVVPLLGSRLLQDVRGLSLVISFALTVVLAELSYRYLEKPFLRLKERFEVVRTRAA